MKTLSASWPPFVTTGEINVHGIIVDDRADGESSLTEREFIAAIDAPSVPDRSLISLKTYYEDVSGGRLRIGNVTAERFEVVGNGGSNDGIYEQFFRGALSAGRVFRPRTHFMFALNKRGASATHRNVVLNFDASMPNPSTLIHEFGHNLGLMHATTVSSDRGDTSDRMGATSGFMEFNAPNLVFLNWLDDSAIGRIESTGVFQLTPLVSSNVQVGLPRVLLVPISDSNFLYLSVRQRSGRYDSFHLPIRYDEKLSIHTRMLDAHGNPKKTCLLAVLGEGDQFQLSDRRLLTNYCSVCVTNRERRSGSFNVHIDIKSL